MNNRQQTVTTYKFDARGRVIEEKETTLDKARHLLLDPRNHRDTNLRYTHTLSDNHSVGVSELWGRRPEEEDAVSGALLQEGAKDFTLQDWTELINETCEDVEKELANYPDVSKYQGSCFIGNIITDKHVITFNLGDCETWELQNGKAKRINNLHNCLENPSECKRISRLGGEIKHDRVNGYLSVTRAFGDNHFNKTKGGKTPEIISHRPEIRDEPLPVGDSYLVMACDGLREGLARKKHPTVENLLAIEFSKFKEKALPPEEMAVQLSKLSYDNGSGDNISVVVIPLARITDLTRQFPLFYFVADGHGGHGVSDFLYNNFIRILKQNIKKKINLKHTAASQHAAPSSPSSSSSSAKSTKPVSSANSAKPVSSDSSNTITKYLGKISFAHSRKHSAEKIQKLIKENADNRILKAEYEALVDYDVNTRQIIHEGPLAKAIRVHLPKSEDPRQIFAPTLPFEEFTHKNAIKLLNYIDETESSFFYKLFVISWHNDKYTKEYDEDLNAARDFAHKLLRCNSNKDLKSLSDEIKSTIAKKSGLPPIHDSHLKDIFKTIYKDIGIRLKKEEKLKGNVINFYNSLSQFKSNTIKTHLQVPSNQFTQSADKAFLKDELLGKLETIQNNNFMNDSQKCQEIRLVIKDTQRKHNRHTWFARTFLGDKREMAFKKQLSTLKKNYKNEITASTVKYN